MPLNASGKHDLLHNLWLSLMEATGGWCVLVRKLSITEEPGDSGGSALHNQILCVLCSQCVHVWLYNSPRCYSIYMKHKKTMHTIIGQLAGFWNWAIMSLIVFIWYTCWYNLHNHLGFIVPLLFLLGTGFARKKWLCPACSTVWINANKWNINKLIRFPLWSWEWSFCCFSR